MVDNTPKGIADEVLVPHDRRTLKSKKIENLVPTGDGTLGRLALDYLQGLETQGYSQHTVRGRTAHLRYFLVWANGIGAKKPEDISRDLLEHYRYELHRIRKISGGPLSRHTKHDRMANVLRFTRWLAGIGRLNEDPAFGVALPLRSRRLPKAVLTAQEAECVLAQPDTSTVLGLRDRVILEVLYATGLRRQELIDLTNTALDLARGVVMVRHGKGRKDRVVPLSRRAAGWILKYIDRSRPQLVRDTFCDRLVVTTHRGPMSPERMSVIVRRYVDVADIGKKGSCHLFRHTLATLMLEGGADLRYVQAMLGHADISTTQIYTRVAAKALKKVHEQTHPGVLTRASRASKRKRAGTPSWATPRKAPPRRGRAKLRR